MSLAIHLLGAPRVMRQGQAVPLPRGRKVWALLSYLAAARGPTSRAHLAALLFQEAADPLAALRWNISELRRLLCEVDLRGDALSIELPAGGYVDVGVLLSGTWSQALELPGLGCELLEGMDFEASPAFNVWLACERRRVAASTEAILREAAQVRLAMGSATEATKLAGRLVTLNPLDENYQTLLIRCLAAAGDGIGAARQAASATNLFRRELGIEPGPSLTAALQTVTATPVARPATGRAAAIAQIEAGEAAVRAGALEPGLQCLRRGIVEADAATDPALRLRARVALGGALVHAARGRDEEGVTALHEALTVAQTEGLTQAATACRELGYVEFLRGQYDRALVWLERASDLAGSDPAEQAAIATVQGAALSDQARYPQALAKLLNAVKLSEAAGEHKQLAYALSMLGRLHLLRGDFDLAADNLHRSIALARSHWIAFLPWPQSLAAETALLQGNAQAASDQFEQAFALGCQMGDPCWEGIAGRGLGQIAASRGRGHDAIQILLDAVKRCVRLPDAYLWGKAYALDSLCTVAIEQRLAHAGVWVDELQQVAARSGMRELVARAHFHRATFDDSGSALAGRMLAESIDNAALQALAGRFPISAPLS